MPKTIAVRLTQAELWVVLNSISQAPADGEPEFDSAHDKLAAAHLKLKHEEEKGE